MVQSCPALWMLLQLQYRPFILITCYSSVLFPASYLRSVNRNTRLPYSESQIFSHSSFISRIFNFLNKISDLHSPHFLSVNPISLLPSFPSIFLMPTPLLSPTSNAANILQYFKQILLYSSQILKHFSKMLLPLPCQEPLNKLQLVCLPMWVLQLQNSFRI